MDILTVIILAFMLHVAPTAPGWHTAPVRPPTQALVAPDMTWERRRRAIYLRG